MNYFILMKISDSFTNLFCKFRSFFFYNLIIFLKLLKLLLNNRIYGLKDKTLKLNKLSFILKFQNAHISLEYFYDYKNFKF